MKRVIKWIKEKSLFCKLMIIYVVLAVVVIAGVCVWEWNSLLEYENTNQEAKQKSHPDLFMDEYVKELTADKYKEILYQGLSDIDSTYYTKESIVENMSRDFLQDISYKRSENEENENRPVYEVYDGEEKILTVTLGVAKRDDFGYNIWKVASVKPSAGLKFDSEVEFVIDGTMKSYINGISTENEGFSNIEYSKALQGRISELVGRNVEYRHYKIGQLLEDFSIEVKAENGEDAEYILCEDVRDYTLMTSAENTDEFYKQAKLGIEAYMKIMNKIINISDAKGCICNNGHLYNMLVEEYNKVIYWNERAENITFTKEEISSVRKVSEEVCIANIEFEATKEYRAESSNEGLLNEKLKGEAIYKKEDGVWKLDAFFLK